MRIKYNKEIRETLRPRDELTIFDLPSKLDFSKDTRDKIIRTHKSIKDKQIILKRNSSYGSSLNGHIFPEFLHGVSDDKNLKISVNLSEPRSRRNLIKLARDNIKRNETIENFKYNLLSNTKNEYPFEFDIFLLQDTKSLYYETVGDGLCGWYALAQLLQRHYTATARNPKDRMKSKKINLKNRKDRLDFNNFLHKLRFSCENHPDKDEEIINAIDKVTSWINSPQGYSNPANDSTAISMNDINGELEIIWIPKIFEACKLDIESNDMGHLNTALFISKDTHSTAHPFLPPFDEDNKKWTHLLYYSGQPNKIGSFPYSTIRDIFNRPNFFYKNHNHYCLLPASPAQLYRVALDSAVLNLCHNILSFVRASLQEKGNPGGSKTTCSHQSSRQDHHSTCPSGISSSPISSLHNNHPSLPPSYSSSTSSPTSSVTSNPLSPMPSSPPITQTPENNLSQLASSQLPDISVPNSPSSQGPSVDSEEYSIPHSPCSQDFSMDVETNSSHHQRPRNNIPDSPCSQAPSTAADRNSTPCSPCSQTPSVESSANGNSSPLPDSNPCRNVNSSLINLDFCDFYNLNFLSKTITHIPTGNVLNRYRSICSSLLDRAENAYTQGDEALALLCWKKFFLLPSVILTNRRQNQSTRNIMLHNLNLIADDDWSTFTFNNLRHVFKPIPNSCVTTSPVSSDEVLVKRISELVGAGNISKAFKALNPTPTAPGNDNTIRILKELHPCRLEENFIDFNPPSIDDCDIFSFNPTLLRKKVHECANLTAPGTSKLRIDHIKQLIGTEKCLQGEIFCTSLSSFISRIANGLLPSELIRFLGSGTLIALSKDNSNTNVRPIVLGDTLRKLAAGLALDTHKGPIQEHFKDIQYGFRTPNGIEIITHAANISHQIHPGWDRLFIDFKNAFNNAIRSFAIRNILDKFPRLSRYAIAYYGITTNLWYTFLDETDGCYYVSHIKSEEGAQQGDSFGPFLFSMGAHPLFMEADRIAGAGFCKALLDDGTVIAPHDNCIEVLKLFIEEGPKYGFYLNPVKTKILLGTCQDNKEAMARLTSFNSLLNIPIDQLPHNIMIHPINSHSTDAKRLYGTRVLGTPIGSKEFIIDWLNEHMINFSNDASRVNNFPNKQCQWLFLYNVLKNKVTHLLRSVDPNLSSLIIPHFNKEIRGVFENILDISCSEQTWSQVTLPFDEGGFNLPDLKDIYIPAYLSSCISVLPHLLITFPELGKDVYKTGNFSYTWCSTLHSLISNTASVASEENVNLDWLSSLPNRHLQRKLSTFWIAEKIKKFNDTCNSAHTLSRISSLKDNSSSAFLRAIPKCAETKFSNSQLVTSFRMRLGIPLAFVSNNMKCTCKGNPRIDPLGDHFHACPVGNLRQARHNMLTAEFKNMLAYAGISSVIEPSLGLPDKNLRPDLVAHHPSFNAFSDIPDDCSKNIYFDISVTHPTNQTHLNKSNNCYTPGSAAAARFSDKMCKFQEIIKKIDALFLPLVFESYGRFHPAVKQLIAQTAKKASTYHDIPEDKINNYWTIRLSCMLHKGNANLLESRARGLEQPTLNKDSWIGLNPEYLLQFPSN